MRVPSISSFQWGDYHSNQATTFIFYKCGENSGLTDERFVHPLSWVQAARMFPSSSHQKCLEPWCSIGSRPAASWVSIICSCMNSRLVWSTVKETELYRLSAFPILDHSLQIKILLSISSGRNALISAPAISPPCPDSKLQFWRVDDKTRIYQGKICMSAHFY